MEGVLFRRFFFLLRVCVSESVSPWQRHELTKDRMERSARTWSTLAEAGPQEEEAESRSAVLLFVLASSSST